MTLLERVRPGTPVGITLLDRAFPAPAPPPTAVLPPAVQRTPAGVFFPVPGPRAVGVGGASYTHTQAQAAAVWIVNHNLGLRPVYVAVQDLAGQGLEGYGVEHVSPSQTRLTFSPPAAGEARIS